MAIEIERKFLVKGDEWRSQVMRSKCIVQAYLAITEALSIRARIVDDIDATLTIKSQGTSTSRQEFEYIIPLNDARAMIQHRIGAVIDKVRHIVPAGELFWEVDEFGGENAGLVLAEIELNSTDVQFDRPGWIGTEVSDDPRYSNSSLSVRPSGTFGPRDCNGSTGS